VVRSSQRAIVPSLIAQALSRFNGMYPRTNIRHLFYVCGQPAVSDGRRTYVSNYSFRIISYPSAFFPAVTVALPVVPVDGYREQADHIAISNLRNMRVQVLPSSRSRLLRWFTQWRMLTDAVRNADLVCVNIPDEAGFLTALVCRLLNKPLLVQVLGDWEKAVLCAGPVGLTRKIKSLLARRMTRIAVRLATLLYTQGRALFAQCREINPSATQSDMVHSTVTEEMFFHRPAVRFHEPIRILTVCRLEPGKGLDVLARSIRTLLRDGVNVEWWCVGAGPAVRDLHRLVETLGTSSHVKFAGHVPHGPKLFRFYKEADIFVLPSFNEGVPNVILEAMAHSLPIIASDVGSIGQVITNGMEGALIPPGDSRLLAKTILYMACDSACAYSMGRAAQRKVRNYMADSFSALHRRLIETALGPIRPVLDCDNSTAPIDSFLDYAR
jgi:glycosyltransferase involved in cell wall biosynthesis